MKNTFADKLAPYFLFPILAGLVLACSDNPETLLKRGMQARIEKKYPDAKRMLVKSIEIKPSAEAYKELGNVYLLGEENLQEAEAQYNRSLEIKPDYINALHNLGMVHIKYYEASINTKGVGDISVLEKARDYLEKALKFQPDFALSKYEMGKYFFYAKKYKEGLVWLKNSLSLDVRNSAPHSIMGQIYLKGLKDNKKAFESFDEAYRIDPKDPDILFFLMETLDRMGKKQDSAQYKRRYEELMKQQGYTDRQISEKINRLKATIKS